MANPNEARRSEIEIHAITQALILCGGAAPRWLARELTPAPKPFQEAMPDPNAYRGHMSAALSLGGLLAAFLGCASFVDDVRYEAPKLAAAPAPDLDALDAIALVQGWRAAGDEKPVAGRLAGAVRNPLYERAWSAEKTGDDSFLVIFREPAGTPAYAFEVNLETEAVEATPEAVERLTMLRVREATESSETLIAREP